MKYFELSNAQKRTIITEISNPGNEAYIIPFKAKFQLEDEQHVKKGLSLLISENLFLRIKKDENINFMQYYIEGECSSLDDNEGDCLSTDDKGSFSIVELYGKDEDEINIISTNFH